MYLVLTYHNSGHKSIVRQKKQYKKTPHFLKVLFYLKKVRDQILTPNLAYYYGNTCRSGAIAKLHVGGVATSTSVYAPPPGHTGVAFIYAGTKFAIATAAPSPWLLSNAQI